MANKKTIFPRNISDWAAFLFTVFGIATVSFVEFTIVFPLTFITNQGSNVYLIINVILSIFIIVNILGNFLKIITVDVSSGSKILSSTLKEDWRFCPVCEANSPPRSYHCSTCQICVLRRDHHCTFTGCCIGFQNYRYFYMFLMYTALGSLYASILNLRVIWGFYDGFSFGIILNHIFPIVAWIFRFIDLHFFGWMTLSAICIYVFLFTLVLMYYHTSLLIKGQTAFENTRNVTKYNYGNWKNYVVDYFGSKWYLIWVFPTIDSPMSGDGINFISCENYKTEYLKNK